MSGDRPQPFEGISVVLAAVAAVVGIVLAFFTSPVQGIIVGMLTEITLETLNSSYKERQYELRLSALAPVPRGAELTTKLAEVGAFIRSSTHADMLHAELQVKLADLEGHLDHLLQGRLAREGSDIRDLLEHTSKCVANIRATTTVSTSSLRSNQNWWRTRTGITYWEENIAAIQRGVAISRVFILDELNDVTETFMRIQADAGVNAHYILSSDLPLNLRSNVIVWDGRIAWRAIMSTTGDITENWIYTRDSDVQRIVGVFQACTTRATTLSQSP